MAADAGEGGGTSTCGGLSGASLANAGFIKP